MFDTIPFLPFGNVTVAAITLMFATGVLVLLYEIGIRLVSFCLAFDSEHAPKIRFKNVIVSLFSKYCKSKVVKEGGYFKVYVGFMCYRDFVSLHYTWLKWNWERSCRTLDKNKAESYIKFSVGIMLENIFKVIGVALMLDMTLKMLTVSFLPTIIVAGMAGLVFAMRYISKSLYKGIHDKQQQLNNHEERIVKMEEK